VRVEEQIHHQDVKNTKEAPRKDLGEFEEGIAATVVDAAIKVHKALGPGLLESVYERCLDHELQMRGLKVDHQKAFPITYEGMQLESALRLDLIVEDTVILELKSVDTILPVHEAQLLTYPKLSGKRLGFLLNFNVPLMRDGIRRKVL
jgi:GxxExxY protein